MFIRNLCSFLFFSSLLSLNLWRGQAAMGGAALVAESWRVAAPPTCGRGSRRDGRAAATCRPPSGAAHTPRRQKASPRWSAHQPRLRPPATSRDRYKRLCLLPNDHNVQFGHLSWAGGRAQLLVTKLVKHSCYFNEISQLPPRLRLLSQRLIFLTIFSELAGVLCPPRVSVL